MSHLAHNIQKIRKIVGMTQPEFSSKMKVTVAMQKSYEGGKATPDVLYFNKLERITGKSTSELMNVLLPIPDLQENIARIRAAEKVESGELFPERTKDMDSLTLHKKLSFDYGNASMSTVREPNAFEERYRSKYEENLERENDLLRKQLDISLGEQRHRSLLTLAIVETLQELVVEFLAGSNRKRFEELIDTSNTKIGEKYQKMKEAGSFPFADKLNRGMS